MVENSFEGMAITTSYRLEVAVIVELIHTYSMRAEGGLMVHSVIYRLVCLRCQVVRVYVSIWTLSLVCCATFVVETRNV